MGVDVNDFRGAACGSSTATTCAYSIVRDGQGSTLGKWGVTGLPETFFVDRKGRVVPPHVLAATTREKLDEGIRRALRS